MDGLSHQELTAGFCVAFIVAQLNLKLAQIAKHILIGGVVLKRVKIGLARLIIVPTMHERRATLTCWSGGGFHRRASM